MERELTEGWTSDRRREFFRGRAAARRALVKLGVPIAPIPFVECGAPVWPPGITGSIAHKRGLALAVAARRTNFHALGVDIDLDVPRDAQRAYEYGTHDELLSAQRAGADTPASVLFVVKEAVYKCVSAPLSQSHLDFHDVVVHFAASQRLTASVRHSNLTLEGRIWKSGPWLASVVWLGPVNPTSMFDSRTTLV